MQWQWPNLEMCVKGLRKSTKKACWGGLWPSGTSNQTSPKYKSTPLH